MLANLRIVTHIMYHEGYLPNDYINSVFETHCASHPVFVFVTSRSESASNHNSQVTARPTNTAPVPAQHRLAHVHPHIDCTHTDSVIHTITADSIKHKKDSIAPSKCTRYTLSVPDLSRPSPDVLIAFCF